MSNEFGYYPSGAVSTWANMSSVTRLGDLLDLPKYTKFLGNFFLVKSFLATFIDIWRFFLVTLKLSEEITLPNPVSLDHCLRSFQIVHLGPLDMGPGL